jgi:anti-sigma regulatory factor (Ser/Thr protein kinase)
MNTITLKPEITELYTLNEFILNELHEENVQVNLIVEEIFVNIVNYSKTEFITVNAEYEKPTFTIEFIDNGFEFNPLLEEEPTMPTDIDEAQVGGLGIFLTKQIADELDYQRINGENHLKIIKNVEQ